MKKFGKVLLVAFMVVMLTAGCTMKVEFGMNIDEDKDVGMKIIMAYDKEMIDSMISMGDGGSLVQDPSAEQPTTTPIITDEQRWAFVDQSLSDGEFASAQKERYEQDGYYGYIISEEFGKLDVVTAETAEAKVYIDGDEFGEGTPVLFTKEGNVYKSNMAINKNNESFSQISQYSTMGAMFDLKFVVTLPVKAISNNADTVSEDGKTLSWDLTKAENLEFEFDLDTKEEAAVISTDNKTNVANQESKMNMMVYIGVTGICVVVLAIVVIVITKNSKKGAANQSVITDPTAMPTTSTPVTPITPVETPVATTPVTPVTPAEPVVPTTPVVESTPVEPVTPTVESAPVEPTVPVTPVVPTEPVVEQPSVAPVMPEAPQMNVNPTEPVVPTTPVDQQNNNF